jgi:hypothetical protein
LIHGGRSRKRNVPGLMISWPKKKNKADTSF